MWLLQAASRLQSKLVASQFALNCSQGAFAVALRQAALLLVAEKRRWAQ
jgi:hypothetical protein